MHKVEASGAQIPALGFGTWTLRDEQAERLVINAIELGYRHIDTAAMYENEAAVGEGIKASGLGREDIFLTSKVWYSELNNGALQASIEGSLKRLGTEYLDLALVHWPSKVIPLQETMEALNDVRKRGLARNIGISNFTVSQIEEAVKYSETPLATNQIEYHPYLNQDKVIAVCRAHNISITSYCPLARGRDLFNEEVIVKAARKYNRTSAQIVLRWNIQQPDIAAIPRTSNAGRAGENFDIFDFALDDAEMAAISGLNTRNMRICNYEFAPVWDTI